MLIIGTLPIRFLLTWWKSFFHEGSSAHFLKRNKNYLRQNVRCSASTQVINCKMQVSFTLQSISQHNMPIALVGMQVQVGLYCIISQNLYPPQHTFLLAITKRLYVKFFQKHESRAAVLIVEEVPWKYKRCNEHKSSLLANFEIIFHLFPQENLGFQDFLFL